MSKGPISKADVGRVRDELEAIGSKATVERSDGGGFEVRSAHVTGKQRLTLERRLQQLGFGGSRSGENDND